MLRKTVGRGLSRRRLKVVQVSVLFLVVGQTFTHMIEHVPGKALCLFVRQVFFDPVRVQAGFVHSHKADGGEMIVEGAEVTLGIRIQTLLEKLRDNGTLRVQTAGGQIHQLIQAVIEVGFIFREIGDARHIDGDHADGTG